jgi:hypothetical protein
MRRVSTPMLGNAPVLSSIFLYPAVVVSHMDGILARIDIATTWVIHCRALSRSIVNI